MGAKNLERVVEQGFKKYKKYIDVYESKSLSSKINGSASIEELANLVQKLEATEESMRFLEANGGIGDFAVLPKIALDVITAASIVDPAPLMASVQTIGEQQGIVYYKDVVSETARNGNTKGQTLVGGLTGRQAIFNAADDAVAEVGATGDGTNKDFAFTVTNAPVYKRTVVVYLESDPNVKAIDDGNGVLIGNGVSGTINYDTGAVTVHFETAPGNGEKIIIEYETAFDSNKNDEIPTILTEYKSTTITTKVFALRTELSLLKQYAIQKRFGLNAEEMLAKDLTTELVALLSAALVKEAYNNAQGVVDWDVTPPSGVSQIEHKLAFMTSVIPQAQANVLNNAGRLTDKGVLVAGTAATAYIMGLPGFQSVGTGFNGVGTMVVGTLNGQVVIRSTVVPANEIVYITKGSGIFEAGLVKADYMPITLTDLAGSVNLNPLRSQKGIATVSGVKAVIPGMMTKIVLKNL